MSRSVRRGITTLRLSSDTHAVQIRNKDIKNINIRTYKYLFTYFQGAERPSASKRSWICSSSLSFSTSRSSVVRWDGDSSGFITAHAQAHTHKHTHTHTHKKQNKNLKINRKRLGQEQQDETKAHGRQQTKCTCTRPHTPLGVISPWHGWTSLTTASWSLTSSGELKFRLNAPG